MSKDYIRKSDQKIIDIEKTMNNLTIQVIKNVDTLKSHGDKIDTISTNQDILIKNTAAVIKAYESGKTYVKLTKLGAGLVVILSGAVYSVTKVFKDF